MKGEKLRASIIIDKNKEEFNSLEGMDIKDIWRKELDVFEEKYDEWLKNKK